MSVAVSSLNRANGIGRVYPGTEPSAFYISNNGGDSWESMDTSNGFTFIQIVELSSKTVDASR